MSTTFMPWPDDFQAFMPPPDDVDALADHEVSPFSVVKNLAVIVITVIVMVKVLPWVRSVELTDDTFKLLLAEHGEDEDEDVTEEEKIEYQMDRRLLSKAIFWNTGSLETDFKFFCANQHPVLQFFARYTGEDGEVYGLSKWISFIIQLNAMLLGFQCQINLLSLSHMPVSWFSLHLIRFVVATLLPMISTYVQYVTLACPCQSSSAVGDHMGSCASCCKFRMGPLMRVLFVINAAIMLVRIGFTLPWDLKLAAVGGLCQGYLLFFLQNYAMWKYGGKWDKAREAAEELLDPDDDDAECALVSENVGEGLRGETCPTATCKVLGAYCASLVFGTALIVFVVWFELSGA